MKDSKPVELLWINPATSKDRSSRSKVRQDVMQKVAWRRKQAPKRSHPNSRQLPLFLPIDSHVDTSPGKKQEQKSNTISAGDIDYSKQQDGQWPNIDHPGGMHMRVLPLIYPTMFVKCSLDFLDLSLLASLEIGRYTGPRLLERPQNMACFLGGKNWSYCRYMLALYGESVLIRSAADCVVARVRCLLTPEAPEWESLAISSYSKALTHLQGAISNPKERPSAELLCATQVLGLYEVSASFPFEECALTLCSFSIQLEKMLGPNTLLERRPLSSYEVRETMQRNSRRVSS